MLAFRSDLISGETIGGFGHGKDETQIGQTLGGANIGGVPGMQVSSSIFLVGSFWN